jgi:hypothetical protein
MRRHGGHAAIGDGVEIVDQIEGEERATVMQPATERRGLFAMRAGSVC